MADLVEDKWKKLLTRAWLFNFIPFINFVFVAGSMAMGNPKEDSDFDVIVGARKGRIFTVRFFCYIFFGILGWRRKGGSSGEDSKDKFCFNHFITSEKYRLSEPHNEYWKKLYLALVPIYGSAYHIQEFYDANADWTHECRFYKNIEKNKYEKARVAKIFKEKVLSGKMGDFLEAILKKIQIKKIEKSLKIEKLYKPRIIFNDSELEFHPDTERIEKFLQK